MKVYLAAPYGTGEMMQIVATDLKDQGHTVVSTWHSRPKEDEDNLHPGVKAALAAQLLREVNNCDVLLYFHCPEVPSRGGQDVELGFAIKAGKQIQIIGSGDKNLFTSMFQKYKLLCLS